MSNYENQSLDQLRKLLKKLQQKKSKKPDPADVDQTKQNIQEKINQLKLQSAELKWTLDKINETVKQQRQKQDMARDTFQSSRSQLDGLKAQQKQATDKLKANFTRRIKNPFKQKKETEEELRRLKASLITDSLSNIEERSVIKDIKKQEEHLKKVELYIEDGGDTLYQERDKKKGDVDTFMKTHNKEFESFDEIRQEMNNLFASLNENRDQQKEIKEKISVLQTQKSEVDNKYRTSLKAYRDNTRKLNDVRQAVAEKEATENEARQDLAHEANRAQAKARNSKAKEGGSEKTEAKKESPERKQVDIKERRRLAEEEWARVQAEQKKRRKVEEKFSRESEKTAEVTEVKESKPDPYREEKLMCTQLISTCKTMKNSFSPGKKNKKKLKKLNKMRLTHKPSVFSHFAMAGVAVPKKYGDLDGCVTALEEKIASFDAGEEEVEAMDDNKDTE